MKNGEVQNNGVESVEDDKWSVLRKLGEDGFVGKKSFRHDLVFESSDKKEERIKRAAAEVRKQYRNKKGKTEESDENSLRQSVDRGNYVSEAERVSDEYKSMKRSRIDKMKSEMDRGEASRWYRKRIEDDEPSTFGKMVRLARDRLGLGEEKFEKEVRGIAANEIVDEARRRWQQEAAKKEEETELKRESEQREVEENMRRALEGDMASGREKSERSKHERLKNQRSQELIERDLNSRLLKIDDLEAESFSDNPEVQKRYVSFEGEEIPVYDLRGFSTPILSTTIDYRRGNNEGEIGTNTYKRIMKNPSLWARPLHEVKSEEKGFGLKDQDTFGDTISASYSDLGKMRKCFIPGELMYGFESVDADSIIKVFDRDGGTKNIAEDMDTKLDELSLDVWDELAGADGPQGYDEVYLRRYTENGMPKKPDYIIVEDGIISAAALRHAKFFGVPIVNIDNLAYERKAGKKADKLIDAMNKSDNYLELNDELAEFLSMSGYKDYYKNIEGIGRYKDIPVLTDTTSYGRRCFEISKKERLKRLDFMEDALERATSEIDEATRNGLPAPEIPAQFDKFNVLINDVYNDKTSSKDEDHPLYSSKKIGGHNSIEIVFRIKGSFRTVKTRIYDGERVYQADSPLIMRYSEERREHLLHGGDSRYYNRFEPLVRDYFEAYRKNKGLA